MNKYCSKCGALLPNVGSFCGKCGNRIDNYNPPNTINLYSQNNISLQNQNLNNQINSAGNIPNQVNNENKIKPKKKKKKFGCLTFLLIFIILIGGLVALVNFLIKPAKFSDNIKIEKDYQYLAVSNDNEYIIDNAPNDIYFYVSSNARYKVLDQDGNLVNTNFTGNKITNPSKYESGKKYTIVLSNGSFVSEQLENAKKVTFKIKRKEVKHHKYNEDVNFVKKNDVKMSLDAASFVSNKKYNVGDVVVIGDKNKPTSAFVVTSINGNTYMIREAALNEIFSELDYYYEEPADLSDYNISEQIKDYVVNDVKNSAWFDFIVQEVYANPKIKIDIKRSDKGLEVKTTISVPAGESSAFLNPKNHSFDIVFKQTLKVNTLVDITLTNWDVKLDITCSQNFEIKIKNTILNYSDAATKKANKELMKKLKGALEKKSHSDTDDKKVDLTKVLIPTPVPCLNIVLKLELINKVTASVDFGVGVGQVTNIVVGFDYGANEEFKFIGSYDKDYTDVTLSFTGKLEEKMGLKFAVGIDILNVVTTTADVSSGLYATLDTNIKQKFSNDSTFEISLSGDVGIFLDFSVSAKFGFVELSHSFAKLKWPMTSYKKSFIKEFSSDGNLKDNSNNNSNDDYGFILEQSKERLEQYSCVDNTEEDTYIKYKFNYENSNFKNITLTTLLYIDTGYEEVDNFLKSFIKFICLFFQVLYNGSYYESENSMQIILSIDKATFEKEFGYVDGNDYNAFKLKMQENGYICK